jgi:hypothetical protein
MVSQFGLSIEHIIHGRNAINTSFGLLNGVMGRPVLEDQWKVEVAYWFSTMLLTESLRQCCRRPRDPRLLRFVTRPSDADAE